MWPTTSQIIIFSGEASAFAATATAAASATKGQYTLLASLTPIHACAALLGTTLAIQPATIAPSLDLWTFNPLVDLSATWDELRSRVRLPGPPIDGNDLPLLPGLELFLAVYRLAVHARRGYQLICVDAGSPDGLLRALAVPDTFRWLMRQLFGLDRGPGQSSDSLARAALPANLLPFEQIGQMQEARVQFEQLRDAALDPTRVRARLVIRPDQAGLRAATLYAPALPLFGLNLDALIVGPLLPDSGTPDPLSALIQEQAGALSAVSARWPNLPLLRLPLSSTPLEITRLAAIGQDLLYPPVPKPPPIGYGAPDHASLSLLLPGVARDDLSISVSGDELIVSLGTYRRHLLLPPPLRGVPIRATREGDRLTIQRR
ncbi:ArsA family ATPase [Chloroflexus sp.]|uniref:ArsA family ATPase n=1 Tax=Chloroflexus sp. TaxID=1904827 RepID=UPI0026382E8D|nr:ArsA-related P-loop ATPase [uncultured Chloroflexus sp.]